VSEGGDTGDLLTLIGRAIEHLQRSVALFETHATEDGVDRLTQVIEEIDHYLQSPAEDPLLHLASLPASRVREGLLDVRADLTSVIDVFRATPDA
jgi:hypothetical protein